MRQPVRHGRRYVTFYNIFFCFSVPTTGTAATVAAQCTCVYVCVCNSNSAPKEISVAMYAH